MRSINLAARPFLNKRPVLRVAMILWVLGAAAALANLVLYGDFLRATQVNRARLSELETAIGEQKSAIQQATTRLGALDLESDNEKAVYLNQLINRRAFPWNRLFDDLESVMPKDILLHALRPSLDDGKKSRGKARQGAARTPIPRATTRTGRAAKQAARKQAPAAPVVETRKVELDLEGSSRSEEAVLDFVDVLFAHPAFASPLLSSESRENGLTEFKISVVYDTGVELEEPFILPPSLGGQPVAGGETLAELAGVGTEGGEEGGGSLGGGRAAGGFDPRTGAPVTGGGFGTPGSQPAPADGGRGLRSPAGRARVDSERAAGFDAAPGATGSRRGTAGRGSAAASPNTVYGGPSFVAPGGGAPAAPGRAGSGNRGVVPPGNLPSPLNPSQSATPRLGGGQE